nr:solute carrier family 33 [Hymenolepis microstoma]
MVFESPDMCNDYFRSTPIPGKGFISFSGFLYACGVLFISSTTLIGLFKREIENPTQEASPQVIDATANESNMTGEVSLIPVSIEELELQPNKENEVPEEKEENPTTISKWKYFAQAYLSMLRMLMLKPVLIYVAFIFTQNFIFLACDSVSGLKLIENGLSKETMALIGTLMMPYDIILPLLVVRWSSGPRPISTMLKFSIPLFFMHFTSIPLVYYVDYFKTETPINATTIIGNSSSISSDSKVSMSPYIYVILAIQSSISSVFGSIIHLSQGTFHARIADPSLGGTYMTLLNTLSNLAVSLPSTILLFFIDPLTWRTCENASLEKVITSLNSTATNRTQLVQLAQDFLSNNATCKDFEGREACKLAGGLCRTIVDGYYLLSGVGFVCGIVAYYFLHKMARYLDSKTVEAYRVKEKSEPPETSEKPGVTSSDV